MKDKNTEERLTLGLWLEKFLAPDVKPYILKELAEEAISHYNIRFNLSEDDLSFQYAKSLWEAKKRNEKGVGRKSRIESLQKEIIDKYKKEFNTNNVYSIGDYGEEDASLWENVASYRMISFQYMMAFINQAISYLDKNIDIPWFKYKQEIRGLDADNIDWLGETGKKLTKIKELERVMDFILRRYNLVTSSLNFENGKAEKSVEINPEAKILSIELKINPAYIYGEIDYSVYRFGEYTLSTTFQAVKPGETDQYYEYRLPSIFPWGPVAAKYFFDFLLLGGQEYFILCKHCKRFTVVQRKGKKKFCSDICRTANQYK